MGSNEQFFYNTQPLIDKAKELGIPEDVAKKQLEKLSEVVTETVQAVESK